MEHLKDKITQHPGLNYDVGKDVDLEWLTVSSYEESLDYHIKKFYFFPDDVIIKLAQINYNKKINK